MTTVAIVGVLTAVALPSFSNINQNAIDTRDRGNAQELASVCGSAQVAGLDFVTKTNVARTIRNIVKGGTVTSGNFAGHYFGVPGMSSTDQKAARKYLKIQNGMLVYAP